MPPNHAPDGEHAPVGVPDGPASGGADPPLVPVSSLSPEEAQEVARIRAALERTHYRREEAASLLGMSRTTLWRKMKEYRM